MVTTSPTVYSHLCTYTSILEADTKPWIKIECNYHTLYINITQIHTESIAITLPSRTKHRAISIYVSKISLIQFLQYWIAFSEWKNGKDYLFIHSSHPSFRYCIAFLFALIWISQNWNVWLWSSFFCVLLSFNANWNIFLIRKAFSLIPHLNRRRFPHQKGY